MLAAVNAESPPPSNRGAAGTMAAPRSHRAARPKVAVDMVVFAVEGGRLRTYLVQLRRGAARGRWAFAGGLVRMGEMLDEAARRELFASTGIREAYLEQLFTFGDPSRDPRAHVVSVAYMALIADAQKAAAPGGKYLDGRWFEVSALPALAYDHQQMAKYALGRLKAKLEYTNIACNLLPETFTFAELEALYAMILERPIDRRNFRRRILSMGILRRLPATRRGAHRPAALYSFIRRDPQVVEML
jgi:ADP-ribose pyrophosphatase YjhB (NUDIX family)